MRHQTNNCSRLRLTQQRHGLSLTTGIRSNRSIHKCPVGLRSKCATVHAPDYERSHVTVSKLITAPSVADNSTSTPSDSWACTWRCATCPTGSTSTLTFDSAWHHRTCTRVDRWYPRTPSQNLFQRLLVLARGSPRPLPHSRQCLSLHHQATLYHAPGSRSQTPQPQYVHLIGTQTQRCEVNRMCMYLLCS